MSARIGLIGSSTTGEDYKQELEMPQTIQTNQDVLKYYQQQSTYSDPGALASLYDNLPDDIPNLCSILHNTIIHMFWIGENTYGITHKQLKEAGREMCAEFSYNTAEERLANIQALTKCTLITPRQPDLRSVGCCRDFSLMLVSILRHKGIPARVRTGVARYLRTDGHLEDHYICESWDADAKRWRQTDSQIDDIQKKLLNLDMDMTDLPANQFLNGWQTYDEIQSGRVSADKVGFPANTGLTYGRNKLFHDLVGIAGYEIPVFAWWGIGDHRSEEESGDDELIRQMIKFLKGVDDNDPTALEEVLELTSSHPRLTMPEGFSAGIFESELC